MEYLYSDLILCINFTHFSAAIVCTGANEVLSTMPTNTCERTCHRLEIAGCVGNCPGTPCICAQGFIRNAEGLCVLPAQCRKYYSKIILGNCIILIKKTCMILALTCPGSNQILSACGDDGCQKTCSNLDPGGCAPRCSTPACICAPGFVRNAQQQCVLPTACSINDNYIIKKSICIN